MPNQSGSGPLVDPSPLSPSKVALLHPPEGTDTRIVSVLPEQDTELQDRSLFHQDQALLSLVDLTYHHDHQQVSTFFENTNYTKMVIVGLEKVNNI